MTNKTEQCLQMHLSRFLSTLLNCSVDMAANKLAEKTYGVTAKDTANLLRAMDNLIGNNAVVLCTKIDRSNGVPPVLTMPKPNAGREINTLAHMVNNYLNDGRDIYGDLAHAAALSREDAIRVFNVMSNWLHDLNITPRNMDVATYQPQRIEFEVSNDFEHMITETMRDVLARIRVYSQQPSTANAPLIPENYDVDVIVSRLVKNIDAIVWGDGINPMRDVTSLTDVITYLLMLLTVYSKSSDDEQFNEWCIHTAMKTVVNTVRSTTSIQNYDKLRQERAQLLDKNKELEGIVQELRNKEAQYLQAVDDSTRKATADEKDVGNQYSVEVDKNGHAAGIGLGNLSTEQLPSFKPPKAEESHNEITKNREVYAFYGNVTININEGK